MYSAQMVKNMKIKELIEATGAKVLTEVDKDLDVKISTDTRTEHL